MQIEGIIIGSRKCATTWLYENYRSDSRISVSEKVKESGFFSGLNKLSRGEYHNLFPKADQGKSLYLEIDTSVLTGAHSIENIQKYNPNMKVALLLRDPVGFFKSRLTHSLRKGEIKLKPGESPDSLLDKYTWFEGELNYNSALHFRKAFGESCQFFKYENIKVDSARLYKEITEHITSGKIVEATPENLEKVNIARVSKAPFITLLYTNIAKTFRKWGLDSVVQYFRNTPLRTMLEKETDINDMPFSDADILECLHRRLPHSFEIHQDIETYIPTKQVL